MLLDKSVECLFWKFRDIENLNLIPNVSAIFTKIKIASLTGSRILKTKLHKSNYVSTRSGQSSIVFVEANEMTEVYNRTAAILSNGCLELSVIRVKNNVPIDKKIVVSGGAAVGKSAQTNRRRDANCRKRGEEVRKSMNEKIILSILLIVFTQILSFSANAQKVLTPELVVQTGGGYPIAISPDNKLIASVANTVKIWDVETGKEVKSLEVGDMEILEAAFSPNGRYLAIYKNPGVGDFGALDLWDVRTGKNVWSKGNISDDTLSEENEIVSWYGTKLYFSGDGRFVNLIEGGESSPKVQRFDVKTGLGPDSASLSTYSFDRNVTAVLRGKMVSVFNNLTKRTTQIQSENGSVIQSISINEDGNLLAISNVDSIEIWNVSEKKLVKNHSINILLENAINALPEGDSRKFSLEFSLGSQFTEVTTSPDGKFFKLTFYHWSRGGRWSAAQYFDSLSGRNLNLLENTSYSKCEPFHSEDWSRLAINECKEVTTESGDKEVVANENIVVWDRITGKEISKLESFGNEVKAVDFVDGRIITKDKNNVRIWGDKIIDLKPQTFLTLVPNSNTALFHRETDKEDLKEDWEKLKVKNSDTKTEDKKSLKPDLMSLREIASQKLIQKYIGHKGPITSVVFNKNGSLFASSSCDGTIKLWNTITGENLKTFNTGSPDFKLLSDKDFKNLLLSNTSLLNLETGLPSPFSRSSIECNYDEEDYEDYEEFAVNAFDLSPNGDYTAYLNGRCLNGDHYYAIVYDIKNKTELFDYSGENKDWQRASNAAASVAFSPDGKTLAIGQGGCQIHQGEIRLFNLETKKIDFILKGHKDSVFSLKFSLDGRFLVSGSSDYSAKLWDVSKGKLLATLFSLDENHWVVTRADGRFDTNKSLDNIKGLHWIIPDRPNNPLPLDVFMRQYYEPGLLQRVLNNEQFKPLPSIGNINRVQPKVTVKEIKPDVNSAGLVDVTIEVESVKDEMSKSAPNMTKKKIPISGAYDLRLFRDGQLIGVSTLPENLEKYIADAPRLVAETKASGKLINTPEDIAWREANDIFKIKSKSVRIISLTKAEYTFRNIRLPRDGRKQVEFTAYAFNSDRVKSDNVTAQYPLPESIVSNPKKHGRAFVVSIGVNASENPAYNLRYAANDARKMQEIVGERLKADGSKYSEIIQIPLISDYRADKKLAENAAQKAIIKGVFSLLAGRKFEDVLAEVSKNNPNLAGEFKKVPNIEKLKAVEPEDTLIITYAGHGYADQSGIFYLLPYDIGVNTTRLTTGALQKTISSDELSLWMLDITAAEMIFIIDACHSSAAVQGDGFKPGPMGSRGLGQLAYDKDMKILSATQANNVALELGSLEQGLLSYALLQDGIKSGLADADKNKQLFSAEWLSYAEKRVPELYGEVKDGKRSVFFNGRNIKPETRGSEIIILDGGQKSSLNLQEPRLFDFRRRSANNILFILP